MLYCAKLTGEDLSRSLNKIESVGLRNGFVGYSPEDISPEDYSPAGQFTGRLFTGP